MTFLITFPLHMSNFLISLYSAIHNHPSPIPYPHYQHSVFFVSCYLSNFFPFLPLFLCPPYSLPVLALKSSSIIVFTPSFYFSIHFFNCSNFFSISPFTYIPTILKLLLPYLILPIIISSFTSLSPFLYLQIFSYAHNHFSYYSLLVFFFFALCILHIFF